LVVGRAMVRVVVARASVGVGGGEDDALDARVGGGDEDGGVPGGGEARGE